MRFTVNEAVAVTSGKVCIGEDEAQQDRKNQCHSEI